MHATVHFRGWWGTGTGWGQLAKSGLPTSQCGEVAQWGGTERGPSRSPLGPQNCPGAGFSLGSGTRLLTPDSSDPNPLSAAPELPLRG